jgi:hypothetical protein
MSCILVSHWLVFRKTLRFALFHRRFRNYNPEEGVGISGRR